MNLRVVKGLIVKYIFICSRNSFRVLDVAFWPLMDLLVWGFLTVYMLKLNSSVPSLITFLIAAVILWNVLYRAQQVIGVMFLDDVWSKNLLNVWAAPIRSVEYVGAAYVVGLVQGILVVLLLGPLAMAMYNFSLLSLGWGFALLFGNLMLMGWALGLLVTGLILRFGPPAEALVWAVPFLVQPFSAVFYPVHVLPEWMRYIALSLPSAHVFEGMREILEKGTLHPSHMYWAIGLNAVYLLAAAIAFNVCLNSARKNGFLSKYAA